MRPQIVGYAARRPWDGSIDRRKLPPHLQDMCSAGNCTAVNPDRWIDLWLHNDPYWLYDTELRAWAAAVDNENLHSLRAELTLTWDGVPGSIEPRMDEYIARHVPPPGACDTSMERFRWELFAFKMFPVRFHKGTEAPLAINTPGVQPLPADYEYLGLDVVSRDCDQSFSHSPLNCNGHYEDIPVNSHLLLDDLELAFKCARHWCQDKYTPEGSYIGPAEPGPYFIVEVHRKNTVK
jgi:hypothetical protein